MTRPTTPANATPAAAALAADHGIDLATVTGTGTAGKITKGDVGRHLDDTVRGLTPDQQAEWAREHQLRQPVDQVVVTPAQRLALLDVIDEHRSIGTVKALRQVGVAGTRGQLAAFVDEDEELAADIREARGYDPERIRSAIAVRAIDGVDEPIVNKDGDIVGYRTIYSDRLLALMAKAHLPEYRDVTRHELTGPNGGPVEVENRDVADALDRFGATIRRLAGPGTDEPSGDIREAAAGRAALPPGSPRS